MTDYENGSYEYVGEGSESRVWTDGNYVYKVYRSSRYEDFQNKLKSLKLKLEMLNSLPEFEKEEIIEIGDNVVVTKQKKLHDWQYMLARDYFTKNKRLIDWTIEYKRFLKGHGYLKEGAHYFKNGICIRDVVLENAGLDDEGNFKILDAKVLCGDFYM